MHNFKEGCEELHNLVLRNCEFDAIGVSTRPRVSEGEKRALEILDRTSKRLEVGWEIGLLWKSVDIGIPFSRANAMHRLRLLESKLDRDPHYAGLYYAEMERLFEKGLERFCYRSR